MKKLQSSKKILAGIIAVVAVVIAVVVYMQMTASVLILAADTVNVEYGESISTDANDYLDAEEVDADIIAATVVTIEENEADSTNSTENQNETSEDTEKTEDNEDVEKEETESSEEDNGEESQEENDYPSVGQYTITLTYKNETATVTVNVSDTAAPEFVDFTESLEYTKDCGPEDITKEYSAEDLSEVTISADESNVDYTKTGEYTASITATDEYGNETVKETTIKVIDPTIKLDSSSKTITVDDTFTVKATITGKDTEATFKSSDTSIATVDDKGKVTGKKAGSATITASANGVEATCKVTVEKKKETTTNTTGSSSSSSSSGSGLTSNVATLRTDVASQIVSLINQERAKQGLSAVSTDSTLTKYAQTRAYEILESFSHYRPNGTSWSTVFDANGGFSGKAAGEILSKGYTSAQEVVNAWMNSSGHRAEILTEDYSKTGVGVVYYNGRYYVAELFYASW